MLANDSDASGTINPASVVVSTAPTHGTTSVNSTTGAITYTPAAGFYGTDTFAYTVANTLGEISAPGTVTVAVDDPPTTNADAALTPENKAVTIAVLANDSDASGTINPASVVVSTAPAHGTTSVNSTTGAITYTPAAGFYGTDAFAYTVANTLGEISAPGTVTVAVDDPPITVPDAASTTGGRISQHSGLLANDSDPDGTINPASLAIGTAPAHGAVSINAVTGVVLYTPNTGFTGTDLFTYTVADILGVVSAPATVSVTISPSAMSAYADGSSAAPAGGPTITESAHRLCRRCPAWRAPEPVGSLRSARPRWIRSARRPVHRARALVPPRPLA